MSNENNDEYKESDDYNNDEEYHFAIEPEEDVVTENTVKDASRESVQEEPVRFKFSFAAIKDFFAENLAVRNSLIAIVTLIILIFLYNFIMGIIASKQNIVSSSSVDKQKKEIVATTLSRVSASQSIQPTMPIVPESHAETAINDDIKKKLTTVEQNQYNLKSEVVSISSQTSGLNANFRTLTENINNLTQQVEKLSATVEQQSHLIATMRHKEQIRAQKKVKKVAVLPQTYLKYNIQAVIPGRAWIVAENGSTLTVRQGSVIAGYGTVNRIDAIQGRISTSSGQVITFSQSDS